MVSVVWALPYAQMIEFTRPTRFGGMKGTVKKKHDCAGIGVAARNR